MPEPRSLTPHLSAEIDCGMPSAVKHAQASFNSTTVGSLAKYHCELGYVLSQHNSPRVCRSQGVWSDPPECDGRQCQEVAEPWPWLEAVSLLHVSAGPWCSLLSPYLPPCPNSCRD